MMVGLRWRRFKEQPNLFFLVGTKTFFPTKIIGSSISFHSLLFVSQ
jgi:hypothetical protein